MKTINKIICPTDFTVTADNAIEYAAKLAQRLGAKIELIHVKSISITDSFVSEIVSDNIKTISDRLQHICDEITKTYKVVSDFSVEVSLKRLEKVIVGRTMENNLIVIGTNGTDNMHQYLFGTNAYNIIKKSKCPVLMIPEKATYKTIEKIVFAWDYSRNNRISFLQLKDFLDTYNPEIVFLHVSKHKTAIAEDIYSALKDEVFSYFGRKETISFSKVNLDEEETVAQKMDSYVKEVHADMLAITIYDRGLFENIFHGDIAKYLSESVDYPLLAVHL